MHHRNALCSCRLILYVVFADGCRAHNDVNIISDIFCALWYVNRRTTAAQHLHLV